MVVAAPAQASTLTHSQIGALVDVLRAFGVDEATIAIVQDQLTVTDQDTNNDTDMDNNDDTNGAAGAGAPQDQEEVIVDQGSVDISVWSSKDSIRANGFGNQELAVVKVDNNTNRTIKLSSLQDLQVSASGVPEGMDIQLMALVFGPKSSQYDITDRDMEIQPGASMSAQIRATKVPGVEGSFVLNVGSSEVRIEVAAE